jgi:hypothetical protein
MQQISEVEEKPFTSSLNMCPESFGRFSSFERQKGERKIYKRFERVAELKAGRKEERPALQTERKAERTVQQTERTAERTVQQTERKAERTVQQTERKVKRKNRKADR